VAMCVGTVLFLTIREYIFAVATCLLYGLGYGCFFAVIWAFWTAVIREDGGDGAAKDMG
jgi:hypothetical protein